MNRIVDIEGVPHDVAPLNRAAIESLYESGVLQAMGKVELIDGVLVRMSPSQSPHGKAITALGSFLFVGLKHRFSVGTDIGVFLGDTQMRAPDLCLFGLEMPPDFLEAQDLLLCVEISSSALNADLRTKADAYARHGVGDYWVIDLSSRTLHCHREPTATGYGDVRQLPWSEPLAPLCAPDLQLILSEIFDGVL